MAGFNSIMSPPEYDFAGLNAGNFVTVINYNKNTPDMAFWACSYFRYGGKWDVSGCKPVSASYCGSWFGPPPPGQPCEPIPLPQWVIGPNPGTGTPIEAVTPPKPK
jgi:hypothetical protein